MKKYIPVFGDQSLFDGAPEDAEYAGWFCQEVRWYMILNGKILFSDGGSWCTSDNPYLSADIAAMRRIIRTPTWTTEDKKAGRLPEVGCKVFDVMNENEVIVKAINTRQVCLESPDGFIYLLPHSDIKPIESPEEKSQREEDEFVASVIDLASENQLMSCGFKDGVIAAYRKLKGGE